LESIFIFILFDTVAWYWYDSNLAKEAAMKAARRACQRHGQQLLDETVVLVRVRPRRDRSGRVRWLRHFDFEFSDDGERRRQGEVTLLGRRVTDLRLALEDYVLHDQDDVSGPSHLH
jgi:hypothetical protein